jgi:long-chain acyl-CoA synthetase
MGTRKILKEVDEIQPDGKILKKLSMGDYEWRSFIEAHTEATYFGKGIRELGVQPRERVAIFAETRAEWMLAAQGFFKQACGIATIYATLGEDGIIYAINQTEVSTIVTSHDLLPKLRNVLDQIPSVKIVIYFEDQLNETNVDGMDRVRIYSYRDVIARGKESFLGEKN